MPSYILDEPQNIAQNTLSHIYENNVVKFGRKYGQKLGHFIGAVNGMRPSGHPDPTSIQSQEVHLDKR